MKFNDVLQLFVVKEKKFYPLFINQASKIEEAANSLVKLLNVEEEGRKELVLEIKELEKKGDELVGDIYEELNKSFNTPFDREDIHTLSHRMETMLDLINDTARKIGIYHPILIGNEWKYIGDCIKEDATLLVGIMNEIPNISQNQESLTKKCKKIKEIEHKVDEVYEECMKDLFEKENNVKDLIKDMNILQVLEDATDKARDVAEIVKTIIIKIC